MCYTTLCVVTGQVRTGSHGIWGGGRIQIVFIYTDSVYTVYLYIHTYTHVYHQYFFHTISAKHTIKMCWGHCTLGIPKLIRARSIVNIIAQHIYLSIYHFKEFLQIVTKLLVVWDTEFFFVKQVDQKHNH